MRDWIGLVESRLRILYHGTDQPIDFVHCRPLTHFGNRKAAINRIAWKATRHSADTYYLYSVEFVGHHPLWIYDNGFNHNLPGMVEVVQKAIAKQSLRSPHLAYDADVIADAVRTLGFDCLAYRNRAEGGTSYVALGPENIKQMISTEMITGQEATKLAAQWHNERYDIR